jgi:hypothetical protein
MVYRMRSSAAHGGVQMKRSRGRNGVKTTQIRRTANAVFARALHAGTIRTGDITGEIRKWVI